MPSDPWRANHSTSAPRSRLGTQGAGKGEAVMPSARKRMMCSSSRAWVMGQGLHRWNRSPQDLPTASGISVGFNWSSNTRVLWQKGPCWRTYTLTDWSSVFTLTKRRLCRVSRLMEWTWGFKEFMISSLTTLPLANLDHDRVVMVDILCYWGNLCLM